MCTMNAGLLSSSRQASGAASPFAPSSRGGETPRHKRKSFPQWYRMQIAHHQDWKCNSCKEKLPPVFDIDHIKPLWDGGDNERPNLQAICALCHALKSRSERYKIPATPDTGSETAPYHTQMRRITATLAKSIKVICPACGITADSRFIAFHHCGVSPPRDEGAKGDAAPRDE